VSNSKEGERKWADICSLYAACNHIGKRDVDVGSVHVPLSRNTPVGAARRIRYHIILHYSGVGQLVLYLNSYTHDCSRYANVADH
jgi:hypothetical protein